MSKLKLELRDPWTPREPLLDGESMKLGDIAVVVPPLNWNRQRKVMAALERLQPGALIEGKSTLENMDDFTEIVHQALGRNYPHLTKEALEEVVDLGNAPALWFAVMSLSGLFKQAEAGDNPVPLTGTPSMPMS